jgi:short-subunit dehydrogenase
MKRYFITGTSSGIGSEIKKLLNGNLYTPTRDELDLNLINTVTLYNVPKVDVAIHVAGHDLGGGVKFLKHDLKSLIKVINCTFLSTLILSKKLLEKNKNCLQVYITSTNLDKFYPNNLAYNVSKNAIRTMIDLLKLDYPDINIKEARVGLTKTEFNNNRHKINHKPINDLYASKHMNSKYVAQKIIELIDSDEKFIRINEEKIETRIIYKTMWNDFDEE